MSTIMDYDDDWSQACASTTSDTSSSSSFVVVCSEYPPRSNHPRHTTTTTNDGDSVSAASSTTTTTTDWSLLGNEFSHKVSVAESGRGKNNDQTRACHTTTTSHHHQHDSSFDESSDVSVASRPDRPVPGSPDWGRIYIYTRPQVLTRRLCWYLTECQWALQNQNSVTAGMRLLPEKDLEGLVAKFLRAATCGAEELPRITMGYKYTEAGDAAWNGIRWEGFCLGRKGSHRNRGSHMGECVGVATDRRAARIDYERNESASSGVESRLYPILEGSTWGTPHIRMRRDDGRTRRPWQNPRAVVDSGSSAFCWIVATVEVQDPYGGGYNHTSSRYVSIDGRTQALVRLFENRRNVLPLVCFDTAVEDEGILEQLQDGLKGVLLQFFREKP